MTLPVLRSRRLVLRPLGDGDAEAIATLGGRDFEIARWMTSFAWPYEEGAAEQLVARQQGINPLTDPAVFAITLGGVFIGLIAIDPPGDLTEAADCPTLGYWLGRPFQGFGYTTEAAQCVLAWAFETHRCVAVAARVYEDNAASRAVLRRLGFLPTAVTERFARPLNRKVRNIVVRLDRASFEDRRLPA
ncbi:GNAT family N-acetyltransferase [Microvirga tunisiensis]|uniref:GNAT family N-acetyltransferase n=1 Tax=Pannonibacter tanglangensis TaxID=2750084 RepID=A0A7X5JAH7_9HYPH|nr:GNAT family N-acetyltransferase [Pannonibacter sp. XCT-53]NBN79425.1 GNAT family N-acetyltransferase [Pannonibacter sp. XCT-53]